MALSIDITVQDNTRLNEIADRFPGTAARALNRTAAKARVMISRRIRDVFSVSAAALREVRGKGTIYVGRKATPTQLATTVMVGARHIPWGKFTVKWNRAMPGAQIIYKAGSQLTIKHSFIPKLKSGHRGVFIRTGPKWSIRGRRYAGMPISTLRQPIKELAGPSPAQMYQDPAVNRDVRQEIMADLEKEVDTALNDIAKGRGR